jgi:putative flavoprotein involved in K+ transport
MKTMPKAKAQRTNTVIIGGGQAGLAMSRCLSERAIPHVILERGRVGERWRSERWDSLRLLTPSWQTRLPGQRYQGSDPDGYMTMGEVVGYLERYAGSLQTTIQTGTTVENVEADGAGYRVTTDRGTWVASNVVIATGYCDVPHVPEMGRRLSPDIAQLVPSNYKNPGQLAEGGVLVVGASATGLQLADEIHASGRPVTLAVGRHTRLPRVYRGRDILWWLDTMGIFDQSTKDVYDIEISRRQPSLQLVGRPDRTTLDLPIAQERGVRLVGRAISADGSHVRFADDLVAHTAGADVRLARLLQRIDEYVDGASLTEEVGPTEPFVPFLWPHPAPLELDLQAEGIRTVLWATGFRRRYPWLSVPVLDESGEIRHDGGITSSAGLYVLGQYFLRRRKSSFIDGVGDDARDLAAHLAESWPRRSRAVA